MPLALAALGPSVGHAQSLAGNRGRTLIVAPAVPAAARGDRPAPLLPAGHLRVAWSQALRLSLEGAPVVDAAGNVWVLASRGDAVSFDAEGAPRAHAAGLGALASGAALLADGTLVVLNAAHEAVFVRGSEVLIRTRLAGTRPSWATEGLVPLPLDDGGVAVAEPSEVTTLDALGGFRARATFPDSIVGPLIPRGAAGLVITLSSGAVYGWGASSSASGPRRLGSFGGTLEAGAFLRGGETLVAVVGPGALTALDLSTGIATALAAALPLGFGRFEGPPIPTSSALVATFAHGLSAALTLSPAGVGSGGSSGAAGGGGGAALLLVDPHGVERGRYAIPSAFEPQAAPAPPSPAAAPAPGATPPANPATERPPPRAEILGDRSGALAIVSGSDRGQTLRVFRPDGSVETLGDLCAAPSGRAAPNRASSPVVAGLALTAWPGSASGSASGTGGVVVACDNGVVTLVTGTPAPEP